MSDAAVSSAPALGEDISQLRWGGASIAQIKVAPISAVERSIVTKTVAALGILIFAQRLAVPPNIEIGFFPVMFLAVWLFAKGYAVISRPRALAYLGICALILCDVLFSPLHNAISVASLAFLLTMHLPFLLRVAISRAAYLRILLWFQIFCLVIATMVFVQWAQQFVHMPMISMDNYVPDSLTFKNYNYIQKVTFYSHWYKPNAFFMLETSHTSQLLAISALIEIALFRRPIRILYVLLAQVSTFGGTGIFILAMGMLAMVFYLRPKSILTLAIAAPLIFVAALQLGVVHNAVERSAQIGQRGTSGNGRITAPYVIAAQTANSSPEAAFLGLGPGVATPFQTEIQDALNPTAKLIVEYGLPIAVLWIVWFHSILLSTRAPFIVTWVVILQYDLVGGALMIPLQTYYCLLLSALFVLPAPASVSRSSLRRWAARGIPGNPLET
jgi:hypothetical protein